MKHTFRLFIGFIIVLTSCKNNTSEATQKSVTDVTTQSKVIEYPESLNKVFDNHGSLLTWQEMKILSYEIIKEEGNEKQTIDLLSRREAIEGSNFKSGFDGSAYWVEADTTYTGNAKFYTNLMFYFYAMPFVLADEGITYTQAEPITFEGVDYPGYRISYGDGIGVSPEDEYFIHYDSESNEMAWLGYTVTFFSGEPSEKISWIRYDDWKIINGLKLPNSLTWYKVKEGKIIEPRNTRKFDKIILSTEEAVASIFAKPEGATVVE